MQCADFGLGLWGRGLYDNLLTGSNCVLSCVKLTPV